jgi:hypothetical protein
MVTEAWYTLRMEPRSLHPSITAVLQYFSFQHLPPQLAAVSRPFAELALHLADTIEPVPELTVALRKLLEAKDAAVRASKQGPPVEACNALREALGQE